MNANTKQPDDYREAQLESRSNVHAGNRLSLGGGTRAMQADRVFSWLITLSSALIMLFIALNLADPWATFTTGSNLAYSH